VDKETKKIIREKAQETWDRFLDPDLPSLEILISFGTFLYRKGKLDGYHLGWLESRDEYLKEIKRIKKGPTL